MERDGACSDCERCPHGMWLQNSYNLGMLELIADAKAYFAKKKRQRNSIMSIAIVADET